MDQTLAGRQMGIPSSHPCPIGSILSACEAARNGRPGLPRGGRVDDVEYDAREGGSVGAGRHILRPARRPPPVRVSRG